MGLMKSGLASAASLIPKPFTPLMLPSVYAWLSADYGRYQERTGASATTPANVDDDPVGTWAFRRNTTAGDGYLTAASDSVRPLYKIGIQAGRPAVRFDGTDDTLTGDIGVTLGAHTIFTVVKWATSTSDQGAWTLSLATSYAAQGLTRHTDSKIYSYHGGGGQYVAATVAIAGTPYIHSRWWDGGPLNESKRAWKNGAAATENVLLPAATGMAATLDLARGNNYLNGDIYEMIVCGRALPVGQRMATERYLGRKWGIAIT